MTLTPPSAAVPAQPDALRLADALQKLHGAKKYHPSGPGGQMLGCEQYRLVTSGLAFEDLQNAADQLRRLHAENRASKEAVSRFHHAIADAGWHPGRTDDDLTKIIVRKGQELASLHAQVAALTAAPQGGAYAELPAPESYGTRNGRIDPAQPLFTGDDMFDFADATHTLRASHGQAPAAATIPHATLADMHEGLAAKLHDGPARNLHLETAAALRAPAPTPQADSQPAPANTRQIAECYGDCPTDPKTCANPCKFEGRAARAPADSVTAPAAGAVAGPGWKLVPVEPTVAQREAMRKGTGMSFSETKIAYCAMLAVAPTPAAQAADSVLEDAARLAKIMQAIRDYHFALDNREHGGVAMARAWNAICDVLNMDWVQGAESAARKQGANHD